MHTRNTFIQLVCHIWICDFDLCTFRPMCICICTNQEGILDDVEQLLASECSIFLCRFTSCASRVLRGRKFDDGDEPNNQRGRILVVQRIFRSLPSRQKWRRQRHSRRPRRQRVKRRLGRNRSEMWIGGSFEASCWVVRGLTSFNAGFFAFGHFDQRGLKLQLKLVLKRIAMQGDLLVEHGVWGYV